MRKKLAGDKSKSRSFRQNEISISTEREHTKLTLRKNINRQKYLSHILQNFDDTFEYELSEKDFHDNSFPSDSMQHNENNTSFALWVFNVRKALSEKSDSNTSSYTIIKSLTQDQVNTLVNILLTYPLDSKLKYESCWVLINLVAETNAFNEYFLLRSKEIYNHLFLILNHDSPTTMCFILIRHIQWFLSNLIQEKEICDKIREEINIPLLIQAVFTYVKLHITKDTSPFNSQINLMIEVNMQMLDFFLTNTDKKIILQYKIFIQNIFDNIKQAYISNNNALIKESFEPLYSFTQCSECIELIANDSEIIEILIKLFDSDDTEELILINIIKNSNKAVNIIQNHDIVDRLILQIFHGSQNLNKISYSNRVMVNIFKLLNAVISYDTFIYLIEKMVTDNQFLGMIPNIFHFYDIDVQYQIFVLYKKFFFKGYESIKSKLIKVNLHIFTIQQLKNILDNQLMNRKAELFDKPITIILELLSEFLAFGEKDKINYIQKALENENIIDILVKLQYHKYEPIYEKANELLIQYWNEDNDNYFDNDINNNGHY